MTVWIGLTGGIGSGKSQVAACFSGLGVPVIDADAVSRSLTDTAGSTALAQIVQRFGQDALTDAGSLNRAWIRNLIFRDAQAKHDLEAMLHPLILAEIRHRQTQTAAPYGIVEIALLAEQPLFCSLVSRVLVIECRADFRLQRVMQRSGLSAEQVRSVMAAQADDSQRAALADDIIRNEGSLNDLCRAVQQLHRQYCRNLAERSPNVTF